MGHKCYSLHTTSISQTPRRKLREARRHAARRQVAALEAELAAAQRDADEMLDAAAAAKCASESADGGRRALSGASEAELMRVTARRADGAERARDAALSCADAAEAVLR